MECKYYSRITNNFKSCRFSNICFCDGRWIFFYDSSQGRDSPIPKAKEALVNLGSYDSSPTFQFDEIQNKSIHIPAKKTRKIYMKTDSIRERQRNSSESCLTWIKQTGFYMHAPSHLYFHWVMDDMLGLFWMMKEWTWKGSEINTKMKHHVILSSAYTQWSEMLEIFFSKHPVLTLEDFVQKHTSCSVDSKKKPCICFSKLVIGPAAHHAGGPGSFQITAQFIDEFSHFLMSRVNISSIGKPSYSALITIITRKGTRQIINDQDLERELCEHYCPKGWDVVLVDMERLSHAEQMSLIQRTTVLIAMHGSGMTNIIFLPKDSIVIELFPYGFSRPTYEFLAKKIGVHYLKWANGYRRNTDFHPEILDSFSLNEQERQRIINAPHFQYDMPWAGNMYWITQDTRIDIAEFLQVVERAINIITSRF